MEREKNGTSRIAREWEGERWEGIERPYTADDVVRLRGSIRIEHTLARMGAERLWRLMHERPFVRSLGALTGNQAVQQVKAGLEAIYLSGWQVAAAPFAEVRSPKAGDEWIVKDGRLVSEGPSGEVQSTPFTLELDIADYTVVLTHPQLGERTLQIPGAGLRHGGKFVFTGSLSKPESFTLREDREN